ncbi:cupin domain-containing protein [Rhodococcus sp. IEGM 1305]|uniref:cupin domain-containing protein n=1 Tax=Rhodococcus sp. IEGM 1305 TaxID=3047092 RepID=UPI0024B7A740|nr:cupin domain-containing protein [Rhodococcus sp. IEGM 1305]MDI9953629.1 cupin domain-containing protein [Rhodococcus sp. IEGM 1305]
MSTRRVVTGFDENGKSVFVSDNQLEGLPSTNTTLSSVWRTASELQIPPKVPVEDGFGFPSPGGTWVLAWTIPPHSTAGEDRAGVTKAGEMPSGGAHATDSVDVNVIVSGSVVFELEDGSERVLEVGDTIVVNGVVHTWRNRGDETATLLSVIFGAERLTN